MEDSIGRATAMFRHRFETYRRLTEENGEGYAWEIMLEGYPERQKKHMGAFIEKATLAEGFKKAIPLFRQMGMEMEVVDISNHGVDAALEVQRTCPVLSLYGEYGLAKPCRVICEMDIEATQRAFPTMKGEILSTQADGACVCVFKYERHAES
jgi:predicted ArsR family transcriptional regulator